MALLFIILIATVFLLFLILGSKDNSQPKQEIKNPDNKEIKAQAEDDFEALRMKLKKLKEDNLALADELKTAKSNEALAREEADKIKLWLTKDKSSDEALKKDLYELKEKLFKKDKEFDEEFSRGLALKKELGEYRQKSESLEADKRENSERLRVLEAQNANLKEEMKNLMRTLDEFKKEKQESQWVSKREYDELKARLADKNNEDVK